MNSRIVLNVSVLKFCDNIQDYSELPTVKHPKKKSVINNILKYTFHEILKPISNSTFSQFFLFS